MFIHGQTIYLFRFLPDKGKYTAACSLVYFNGIVPLKKNINICASQLLISQSLDISEITGDFCVLLISLSFQLFNLLLSADKINKYNLISITVCTYIYNYKLGGIKHIIYTLLSIFLLKI